MGEGSARVVDVFLVADLVQGRPLLYAADAEPGAWSLASVWAPLQANASACLAGGELPCTELTFTALPSGALKLPGLWASVNVVPDDVDVEEEGVFVLGVQV